MSDTEGAGLVGTDGKPIMSEQAAAEHDAAVATAQAALDAEEAQAKEAAGNPEQLTEERLAAMSDEELEALDSAIAELQVKEGPPPSGRQPWKGGPFVTPSELLKFIDPKCSAGHGERGLVRRIFKHPKTRRMHTVNEVCECAVNRYLKAHRKAPVPAIMPKATRQPAPPAPGKGPEERAAAITKERAKAAAELEEIAARVAKRAAPHVAESQRIHAELLDLDRQQAEVAKGVASLKESIELARDEMARARARHDAEMARHEAGVGQLETQAQAIAKVRERLRPLLDAAEAGIVAARRVDVRELRPLEQKIEQCDKRLARLRAFNPDLNPPEPANTKAQGDAP